MSNDGWIKIYRRIEENHLWLLEPFTKGQAWIDLIMFSNHKENTISIRGNILTIKRGQIAWSEITMASRWQWSRNKVRRYLKYLETIQQIEQQKDRHITSIITIMNYDKYQNDTTDETTERQQTIHKQECKERKECKEDKNNTSTIVEEAKPKTFGKEEINKTLSFLKETIGIEDFANTDKWKRIYAQHIYNLIKKVGKEEFLLRLQGLIQDKFHKKNINKIDYLYNQLKGFIKTESKIQENPDGSWSM